jgi:serine/threonine-protein kinase HipA
MSMIGSADGERVRYPELVDTLTHYGANAKADAAGLYRRMVFNVLVSNVDDHLRNHGFLWLGKSGWTLSPAYDPNRCEGAHPDDQYRSRRRHLLHRPRQSVADYFGLNLPAAQDIIREVGQAVAGWRAVATAVGARSSEINRMASAFEHEDLTKARAM